MREIYVRFVLKPLLRLCEKLMEHAKTDDEVSAQEFQSWRRNLDDAKRLVAKQPAQKERS